LNEKLRNKIALVLGTAVLGESLRKGPLCLTKSKMNLSLEFTFKFERKKIKRFKKRDYIDEK